MKKDTLRKRLRNGEPIVGLGMRSGSTDFIEIAGMAGFDFVYIDRQHDINTWDALKNFVLAADVVDIACIIRVEENHAPIIWRSLDIGAQGVLVPDVFTKNEMIKVVQAAKYPPDGNRGEPVHDRSSLFHVEDWPSYMRKKNDETTVWIMVESKKALDNLDDILSVKWLDCVTFGPVDYSLSVGVPGQREHPLIKQAQETILRKAKEHGVAVQMVVPRDATGFPDLHACRELVKRGANCLLFGVDKNMFMQGCKDLMERVVKKLK